jgi:hypothetical protein
MNSGDVWEQFPLPWSVKEVRDYVDDVAKQFVEQHKIRQILEKVDIDQSLIFFESSSLITWRNIFSSASAMGKVKKLRETIEKERAKPSEVTIMDRLKNLEDEVARLAGVVDKLQKTRSFQERKIK